MNQFAVLLLDVVYLAKVQISKQITTRFPPTATTFWMLFTLQRYKFLSKSQQHVTKLGDKVDVVYLAKVQISKQITTEPLCALQEHVMLFTLQRYKFLSKSQLNPVFEDSVCRCCLPCKGTNF